MSRVFYQRDSQNIQAKFYDLGKWWKWEQRQFIPGEELTVDFLPDKTLENVLLEDIERVFPDGGSCESVDLILLWYLSKRTENSWTFMWTRLLSLVQQICGGFVMILKRKNTKDKPRKRKSSQYVQIDPRDKLILETSGLVYWTPADRGNVNWTKNLNREPLKSLWSVCDDICAFVIANLPFSSVKQWSMMTSAARITVAFRRSNSTNGDRTTTTTIT